MIEDSIEPLEEKFEILPILRDTNDGYACFEDEPWQKYRADFPISSFYFAPTRPFRIWYEYVKLSPTGRLAYEFIYSGKLDDADLKNCPEDFFDTVVPFYKDMVFYKDRELEKGAFDKWWLRHGADMFGMRDLPPDPTTILKLEHHKELTAEEMLQPLASYMDNDRRDAGNAGFILLAVPLNGDKKKMIKAVEKLIQNEDFTPVGKPDIKTYKLYGQRKRLNVLPTNLRVLWHKALNPDLELWRVGHLAKITDDPRYLNLNPSKKNHTLSSKCYSERLASITSNRLQAAIIIMENAVRGRFPCDKADLLPELDHQKLLREVSTNLIERVKLPDAIEDSFNSFDESYRLRMKKHLRDLDLG